MCYLNVWYLSGQYSPQRIGLSHKQLQELNHETNLTLYTDETKKSDIVYMSYAVTTSDKENKVFSIQQLPRKSAQNTLDYFVKLVSQVSWCLRVGVPNYN